jgi:hypothetical protein
MELKFRVAMTFLCIVSLLFVYDVLFGVSTFIIAPILGLITSTTTPTTANVTVRGTIGAITVYFSPVNFSTVNPGNNCNPKVQGGSLAYINISLNASTNTNYNIYFLGTALNSTQGINISVATVHFANASNGCPTGDTELSAVYVTNTTAFTNIPYTTRNVSVYFWVDTPIGSLNTTYTGNITILVNGTAANNSETWFGLNNLTLMMDKYIDLSWDFAPINFSALTPGTTDNRAMTNQGNPANLSVNVNTNIRVDGYINGSNLNCIGGGCGSNNIAMGNISFTNMSTYNSFITTLSASWQNFMTWNNSGNTSDLLNYWNISIVAAQPPGNYGGNITGKAVDTGTAP